MNFELPPTALAMEIAGTAAHAVGAGQTTLTFPMPASANTEELLFAVLGASGSAEECITLSVNRLPFQSITVTL